MDRGPPACTLHDVGDNTTVPETVDHYRVIRRLGSGSFGEVVEAEDTLKRERVAIKLLHISPHLDVELVRREIMNHCCLHHHHVIRFIKVLLAPSRLGIVMEFAERGNLRSYIRRRGGVGKTLARFLFQQLVLGVEYCHLMQICNRDIKLQNTLMTGNPDWPMLKICDFGYSKHAKKDTAPNSVVGSLATMAPEVLSVPLKGEYDGYQADVWSIGVFLYDLAVGRNPFVNEEGKTTDVEVIKRILNTDYSVPDYVADDCSDLIKSILVKDPAMRPTVRQIKAHPYFTKNLPPGAAEMNERIYEQRVSQSIEEIDDILARAKESCKLVSADSLMSSYSAMSYDFQ